MLHLYCEIEQKYVLKNVYHNINNSKNENLKIVE